MRNDDQPSLKEDAKIAYTKNMSLLESLGNRKESLLDESQIKE